MNSVKPTEKVQAGGYAGATALLLIWILGSLGIEMPSEVAAGTALLIAGFGAWLKTEGAGWCRKGAGDHRAID